MADRSGYLQVQENPPHTIFWEEAGNPNGEPVLSLHGGPGAGSSSSFTSFDRRRFRIFIFDQRGCGSSAPNVYGDDPAAALTDNTTQHSINDILLLRKELDIRGPMHMAGGSWGTTLALAYAIQHPETVKSLLFRAVFLGRREDADFCFQGNASVPGRKLLLTPTGMVPTRWRRFMASVHQHEYDQLISALNEIFATPKNRRSSSRAYNNIRREWRQFADIIQVQQRGDLFRALNQEFESGRRRIVGTDNTYRGPFDRFIEHIPPEERGDTVKYLAKQLIKIPGSEAERERMTKLAEAFVIYQNIVSQLDSGENETGGKPRDTRLGYSRIALHYAMNGYFLGGSGEANRDNNYILKNLHRLKNIPFFIVHGRYDSACQLKQAYDLVDGLRAVGNQNVDFLITPVGHSPWENSGYLRDMARKLPVMYPYGIDHLPPVKMTRKRVRSKIQKAKRPAKHKNLFRKVREFHRLNKH